MKRFIAITVISAISSIIVSSVMNSLATPRNSNSGPRCSVIELGGRYWLEYKDNNGATQSTQATVISRGAKVCISNTAR